MSRPLRMGSRGTDDVVCGNSEWGTHFYPTTNLNNDGMENNGRGGY